MKLKTKQLKIYVSIKIHENFQEFSKIWLFFKNPIFLEILEIQENHIFQKKLRNFRKSGKNSQKMRKNIFLNQK